MPTLREATDKPKRMTGGHRMCAGCAAPVIVRQILYCTDAQLVLGNATGCLEVATSIYPYSAWNVSWIHCAFENAAATLSGVESAYRSLKKQGKIKKDFKFVCFGGDGGTYDIGFQSLSGMLERGHNVLYVCYDNGAYMNTGIQRSSATPRGADTTTSPVGNTLVGKQQARKDLTAIVAAHNIPYAAQASPSHYRDLMNKAQKALAVDGPAFLNVISSCPPGWHHEPELAMELTRKAVETRFWPLFEVENGNWRMTYKPRHPVDLEEWLRPQGRFRHLFHPENQALLEDVKSDVERNWQKILQRCGEA
ncbi:MAG: pyruvate ferredoxin oxidoreductase [Firmicutes bacterium]|nr:pyruvate ferredoxin oxidoreductase [Bacillota bacterium]